MKIWQRQRPSFCWSSQLTRYLMQWNWSQVPFQSGWWNHIIKSCRQHPIEILSILLTHWSIKVGVCVLFQYKTVFHSIGNITIKIRQLWDCVIIVKWITKPVKWDLYAEMETRWFHCTISVQQIWCFPNCEPKQSFVLTYCGLVPHPEKRVSDLLYWKQKFGWCNYNLSMGFWRHFAWLKLLQSVLLI